MAVDGAAPRRAPRRRGRAAPRGRAGFGGAAELVAVALLAAGALAPLGADANESESLTTESGPTADDSPPSQPAGDSCPERLQLCSGHGTCEAAPTEQGNATTTKYACVCSAGYTGETCAWPLTTHAPTDGSETISSVAADGWTCYSYDVPSGSHSRYLTLELNATSGDPDLYIKHGSYPTLYDFAFRDYTNNAISTLVIDREAVGGKSEFAGEWFACIHGFGAVASSFRLRTLASACPAVMLPESASPCGEAATPTRHGTCDAAEGVCHCEGNYGVPGGVLEKESCSTSTHWIENSKTKESTGRLKPAGTGALRGRDWAYFKFNVSEADFHVQVDMRRTSEGGDPDLYMRYGAPPTLSDYDLKDSTYVAQHNISLVADEHSSKGGAFSPVNATNLWREGTWYVGVYAYGAFPTTFDVFLQRWACLAGCSGHGECDASSHVCACDEGWRVHADCSSSEHALDVDDGGVHWTETDVPAMEREFFELNVSDTAAKHHVEVRIEATYRADGPVETWYGNLYNYVTVALKKGGFPDVETEDYDYVMRLKSENDSASIHVPASMVTAGKWGAVVYNPTSVLSHVNISASLLAFCPDDCFAETGNGVCGPDGVCRCHGGFVGANCVPSVECLQGMFRPEDIYDKKSHSVIGECYRGCNPATSKFYAGGKCERITCEEPFEPDGSMTGCEEKQCRSDVHEPTHDGHGTCTRECTCPQTGLCRLSDACASIKCDKGYQANYDLGSCDPPACQEGALMEVHSKTVHGGSCAAACVCTSEFECAYDEANCKPSCAEEHFATPNADGTAWVCAEAEMPGVVRAGGGMGGGAVFGLCVLMLGVGAGGMYALEAYRRRARGSASMGYQLGEVGDDGMLF